MKKRFPNKQNVLLVNITRLGDMLQATPTIAGLKQENPESKITVLVEKQFEDVCYSIPNIDHVVSLDLGMTVRSLAREGEGIIEAYEYLSKFVDELRAEKFDYCLNMSSSAYTAMLLKLVGIERNGGWTADDEGYRVIESDWAKLFASSVFHQNRQYNALNLVDVFRCSADVDKHPKQLLINVSEDSLEFARRLVEEAQFTNTGPLVAVQAGASQDKRQWETEKFIKLVKLLVEKHNFRIVLTGAKKELAVIDPIKAGVDSQNVFVAAGKTNIPQLSALLKISDLLITGDTGPMHIAVAVGTPVVSMFVASAFGFETGPYSEGNIVIQPLIGCGPCNPNKPCAKTDCHDHIPPELVAALAVKRMNGDFSSLPDDFVDPSKVIIYRSFFDPQGFCCLAPLTPTRYDTLKPFRDAYRKVWLDDLGGFEVNSERNGGTSALKIAPPEIKALDEVVTHTERGVTLINKLIGFIRDASAPARSLGALNEELSELDREIEYLGYHHPYLGPMTRMFVFAKENLSGSDPFELASQMGRVYEDLLRRSKKLGFYYHTL